MSTSEHFNHFGFKGTQELHADLYAESIKHRGVDVKYIRRTRLNDDTILGESDVNRFQHHMTIEMLITDVTEFNGDGDLFAKFNIDLSDTMTWEVSSNRFKEVADLNVHIEVDSPQEGDLIFLSVSNSLWEITKVKGDSKYYINGQNVGHRLTTQLFEYSHEDFATGEDDIDDDMNGLSTAVDGLIASIENDEGIKAEVTEEIVNKAVVEEETLVDFVDPTEELFR